MNTTIAKCGCSVTAEGAPGSGARRACEARTCNKPRCRSRLPEKFTDTECEIYCHLHDTGCRGWLIDLLNKSVVYVDSQDIMHNFPSLRTFEQYLLRE